MNRLKDLQHPGITAAERTGYPSSYYRPTAVCSHCKEEVPEHDDRIMGDYVVCQGCHEVLNSPQTKMEFTAAVSSPAEGDFFGYLRDRAMDDDSPVPELLDDYIETTTYDFEEWAVTGKLTKGR